MTLFIRLRQLSLTTLGLAVVVPALGLGLSQPAMADPVVGPSTVVFGGPGDFTWTAPAGADAAVVDLYGAQGGSINGANHGGKGGPPSIWGSIAAAAGAAPPTCAAVAVR